MSKKDKTPRTVEIGTRVRVELVGRRGDRERLAFDLVADEHADYDAGFLGAGTPLAKAILGKIAGESVPYKVGDLIEVRVLGVGPSARGPAQDTAAKREAALRDARSKSELNNMISFALTFDSKWGDYDPEVIASKWDEDAGEKKEDKEEKKTDKEEDSGAS